MSKLRGVSLTSRDRYDECDTLAVARAVPTALVDDDAPAGAAAAVAAVADALMSSADVVCRPEIGTSEDTECTNIVLMGRM